MGRIFFLKHNSNYGCREKKKNWEYSSVIIRTLENLSTCLSLPLNTTNITQESKRYQMSRSVSGQLAFFGLHQQKIVLREILSKYIRDLKKYVQTQQMFEFTFFSWCLSDFFGFTLNPATQSLQFLSHLNDYELRYWLQPLPV